VIRVAGGTFVMGSDRHDPEKSPAHTVEVAAFVLAAATVTVAEFGIFVTAASGQRADS
jgi:sulfatase modifying factor 1